MHGNCILLRQAPCENDAACFDRKNGFVCECLPGFSGLYCETNVPDCLSQPCLNGATCIDGVQNYTCECTALYQGNQCQDLIDGAAFSYSENMQLDYSAVAFSFIFSCGTIMIAVLK